MFTAYIISREGCEVRGRRTPVSRLSQGPSRGSPGIVDPIINVTTVGRRRCEYDLL